MNSLDIRDRHRAKKIIRSFRTIADLIPLISAALKREREDAFADAINPCPCPQCPNSADDRAKARRAIKRGAKVSA